MVKVFDRGDIICACLDPVLGSEMRGAMRPMLVLSKKEVNRTGMTFIAPITQGGNHARFAGFAVPLIGCGTETQGVVVVSNLRALDLSVRQPKFIERLDTVFVDDVLAKVRCLFD
jgi:mRNA interferase ChpB